MLTLHTFLVKRQIKDVLKLCKHANCNKRASVFAKNRVLFAPSSVGVHTPSSTKVRIFKDTENVYAHNILQSMPVFPKELCLFVDATEAVVTQFEFEEVLNQDWRAKSANEITDCFKRVLNYCVENNIAVSDDRFDRLVDGLMDRVQDLTDTNLSDLLTCLANMPICDSYTAHNFHDMWSALDDVCCWRLSDWSTETSFLFADHWYRLNLAKLSDYVHKFIDRCFRKVLALNRGQIVHLFVYMTKHKRLKPTFDSQCTVDKYVGEMSIDEISLVSATFTRFEIKMKVANTAATIIAKAIEALPYASDMCLSKVFHVLRYSSHTLLIDQLVDLLDRLIPEIDRLSTVCCIHAALLGTTLQFFHPQSLEKISQKIVEQITDVNAVRLKDIERLLLALTMFDFDPNTTPNLFDSVRAEIHKDVRRVEFVKYPRCLPSILNFLSLRNVYSDDLMSEVLDRQHILETYGKNSKSLSRDVFFLDVCAEVERPRYVGNRLDLTYRRKVAKWHVEYAPTWDQYKKVTFSDRFVLEVVDAVTKVVGGRHNLVVEHVLPNYVKADIVVCKDLDGHFRPPVGLDEYVLGDVMRPTRSDLRWLAVVTVNWNACIRNTSKPLGLVHMKARQLRAIGYTPVLVVWNEFLPLNEKERIGYINDKIS